VTQLRNLRSNPAADKPPAGDGGVMSSKAVSGELESMSLVR